MTLQQLLKVDEATETVTMNVWLNMEWTDELLKWDTQEYGKMMRNIRIKPKDIWTPDIEVYNKVNMKLLADTDVVVSSDGSCMWIPPYVLTVSCKMDTTRFPFDEQTCTMKAGSWVYNGFELNLQEVCSLVLYMFLIICQMLIHIMYCRSQWTWISAVM